MKPKHYIPVITAIIALAISLFLSSCGRFGSVTAIKMENEEVIEVKAGEFSYDGINVVLIYANGNTKLVSLTESMIPEADKLNFFKMGEHDIHVNYTSKLTTTMKINVVRHEFDDIYRLDGYTCVYDGKPHKVEINYELPEGTKIEYPYGNTFTNAGEYTVEAVISKAGYVSRKLSTKLIIEKATIDISEVKLEDQSYVYDGEVKTIEATGIPQGIKVEYELWNQDKTVRLNNAVNAGIYKVVAKFTSSDENYNQSSVKEATLTITKSKYDMTDVRIKEDVKDYDGREYEAKLVDSTLVPEGVKVSFKYYNMSGEEVKSTVDAGEYKIVASFDTKNSNYEDIAPIEGKLVVNKKQITLDDKIIFNSKTINFDREMHSLEIETLQGQKLPENVEVTYENNGHKAAGEYKVIARFTDNNKNEVLDISELEAYLKINTVVEAPQVTDKDTGKTRDFEARDLKLTVDPNTGNKTIAISGFLDEIYEITKMQFTNQDGNIIDVNDFSNGVKYNYNISFRFKDSDENSSVSLSPTFGTIQYDIHFDDDLKLEDSTVTYDGKPHGVSINKELPTGTTITYPDGEEFIDVGTYQISWVLSKETYGSKTLTGNLKITQAEYDMSEIVLEDVTRAYDGKEYIPENPESDTYNPIFDKLPDGVTVKEVKYYTTTDQTITDETAWVLVDSSYTVSLGIYKIVVSYAYDEKNYKTILDMDFILTVIPATIDLSNVKFEDLTIGKTGGYFFMSIKGTPYMSSGIPQFAAEIDPTVYYPYPVPTEEAYKLPENVYVTYTYKDSNGNVIATVDTTKYFKVVIDTSGICTKVIMVDFGYDEYGAQVFNNDIELLLPKEAGTYTVIASFTSTDNKYAIPDNSAITVTLTLTEPQP